MHLIGEVSTKCTTKMMNNVKLSRIIRKRTFSKKFTKTARLCYMVRARNGQKILCFACTTCIVRKLLEIYC